jgi:hypothetical protein
MNTLEMARAAGFVVLLDGRIGRETYHSVTGSVLALERFQALCRGSGNTVDGGDAALALGPDAARGAHETSVA